MISIALAEQLATGLSLTLGKDVFAESAQGEKYVLVKDSYVRPWTGMDSQFRTAHVQVVVCGYHIAEGSQLSEQIVNILEPFSDTLVSGSESFSVRSVRAVGLPILATYKDFRAFSINFSVSYLYETLI